MNVDSTCIRKVLRESQGKLGLTSQGCSIRCVTYRATELALQKYAAASSFVELKILAWAYVFGAPVVFPLAAVFQTSSVYFCVAAAVDCFIIVVLPQSVNQLYCTPRRAKITCICIMIICVLYNIPHFFELEKRRSLHGERADQIQSRKVVPTTYLEDRRSLHGERADQIQSRKVVPTTYLEDVII
ncbi:hypothetical protein DICVIV_06182 [Dictyocaulus viviparus]|uniref:G-protein coupled receptors family 1 profile domain-containing protein n=1 Tax=Dictyocaulus viviparus TaxID=29172 RepID=A0A0D8XT86_DICVI|nr:hypothetical protein DICVIV_06182 [Dictyocaulus viviparus]